MVYRKFGVSLIGAAGAAMLAATSALAGTLSYDGYSVTDEQNVTIRLGASPSEYGGAGQIGLATAGGTFNAWCVDVDDWLQWSGTYLAGASPAAAGLSTAKAAAIAALIANFGIGKAADPSPNTNASAALQIAIWEVEYGSALTVTPDNSALTPLAATYVADVTGASPKWTTSDTLSLLYQSDPLDNQNLAYVTANTVGDPVPAPSAASEPASAAVLSAGLIALLVAQRRRAVAGRRAV